MKKTRFVIEFLCWSILIAVILLLLFWEQVAAQGNPSDRLKRSVERFQQRFHEEFTGEKLTLEEIEAANEERKRKRCEWLRNQEDYDPELDGCDEDEEWEDQDNDKQ